MRNRKEIIQDILRKQVEMNILVQELLIEEGIEKNEKVKDE